MQKPTTPSPVIAPILPKLDELKAGLGRLPAVLRLVWRTSPLGALTLLIANLAYAVIPLAIAWAG